MTSSIPKGMYGESEVVQDGTENGMKKYVMRPARPPYIEIEVIDGIGSVSPVRTGMNERFWHEHLEGQGGDPDERAAKGRRDTNRIIVAILNGPGALSGERLQAARRKHGYEVVPNAHGHISTVGGRDQYGRETMGRAIKVIDSNSEIAKRRAGAEEEMRLKRAARMAQKMDTVNAAAALLNAGAAQAAGRAADGVSSAEVQALREQNARLEAKLDALAAKQQQAASPATPLPEDDEDSPPPQTSTRKGK